MTGIKQKVLIPIALLAITSICPMLLGQSAGQTANSDLIAISDTLTLSDTIPLNNYTLHNEKLTINDTLELVPDETVQVDDSLAVIDTPSVDAPEEEPEEEPVPSNWESGGRTAVTFSQISLSNWSGGGINSASLSSMLNLYLNYSRPDGRLDWENTLDMGYGLVNQEHRRTVKSDDKFDFSTKIDRKASEFWSYSALLNFRTQMAPGYKAPGDTLLISRLMAPAYLNISVGMDHRFDDNVRIYLSPVAGRIVYVLDEELSERGSFGVEPGETRRNEFGGLLRITFRTNLMDNISVNSRLELFSNYLDKPQNINVNSDTRISMEITRFISANLMLQMLYDDNARIRMDDGTTVGPRLQIKQVFGLGFSYRL